MGEKTRSVVLVLVGAAVGVVVFAAAAVVIAPLLYWGHPPTGKKATCTQNLIQISKAFRMYASDWDDRLPTNRWNGSRGQFLSRSCKLSEVNHKGTDPQFSANFVEALIPYLEKLEDTRYINRIWNCPATAGISDPTQHVGAVTYCMNWYLTEQPETSIADLPNTLLMREMGKPGGALLRPYPSRAPDAQNPRGSGPPVHAFPSEREFGADTLGPVIHVEGSMVLFADGHVSYRPISELSLPPIQAMNTNGKLGWRVGSIWLTP